MSETYGDYPGVEVETSSKNLQDSLLVPEMSEYEYQLVAIFIRMATSGNTMDTDAVLGALECYGYGVYDAYPMIRETKVELYDRQ